MSLITDFIEQNRWANHALIAACRDLTDEQLDATTEGVFGSIRQTWGHIVSAELWYAHLLGIEVETWDDDTEPWPGWDAVAEMVDRAATALTEAASGDPERLIRTSSGRFDVEARVVLVQAYHHGTDHRSQICTLLTLQGIEPPEWSSWTWGHDTGLMQAVEA